MKIPRKNSIKMQLTEIFSDWNFVSLYQQGNTIPVRIFSCCEKIYYLLSFSNHFVPKRLAFETCIRHRSTYKTKDNI